MEIEVDDQGGGRRIPHDAWHILELAAIHFPDKLAVVDCGNDALLTYADLHLRASTLAAWMKRRGVRRGDHIGVLCRNSSCVMEMHFAAAALHAVVVNINIHLAPAELDYILGDSTPVMTFIDRDIAQNILHVIGEKRGYAGELVIVDVTQRDSVDHASKLNDGIQYEDIFTEKVSNPYYSDICSEALSEGSDEDGFHMYYTSGTTGKPKGVVLSHRIVVQHAVGTIQGKRNVVLQLIKSTRIIFNLKL